MLAGEALYTLLRVAYLCIFTLPFHCLCLPDCATPIPRPESIDDVNPGATAKASAAAAAGDDVVMPPPSAKARSRSVRRKDPVRAKADAAGSDASMNGGGSRGSSVDEGGVGDANACAWVCQICSGHRTEKERFAFNRRKLSVRLAAS